MLRRTYKSRESRGNPIITLPSKTVTVVPLSFNESEQHFYQELLQRTRTMFNEYILQGVVMHQYAMILSLLLAVRQACDHPFLLLSRAKDVLQRQEEEVVQKALTTDIIERIYEVAFQGKKEVEAYAESVLRELKEKTVEDLICPVKDGCAKLGLDLQFIDSSQTGVYILFTLFL